MCNNAKVTNVLHPALSSCFLKGYKYREFGRNGAPSFVRIYFVGWASLNKHAYNFASALLSFQHRLSIPSGGSVFPFKTLNLMLVNMTREEAKSIISKLVERFAEHRNAYHAPEYNEAKTRQDFINPFFKALGWDVDNENGISEAYREVIYEDKVVVRGKAKAPDYGFRLMGQGKKRLFYVEAKKPSVALKANKDAAYQLRRYGSSAQAPISILTNFEDFFVYDCSKVPNLNDSASVSRLKHIHFEDYLKDFDFIYDTFSHEAVTKGRFDKFVQSDANKKGSQTLDKEFVQSLDTWRKYLATRFAQKKKKISDEELNFCVQLIIDRLIFLRFCEDRAVEPYGQLQSAASKGHAYNNLFELFEQADAKYNSGLFDFEKDKLTATLKIDNKVIKNIVDDLYYPQCRYEFSVMPVEVLGNAYEQFLGKVIRILPSRGVKIEEKPEVRKAGGVFYTPQYIVEYIVKNTVGKLIEGKTPSDIEKLKIVDPACGSGSFLVGAFEYLLNYHIDWYHRHLSDKEKKKGAILTPDGKLSTHEKKRILINNIYGVDLDANAVEVSKLSLLLKCMEGETEASIKQQVTMFHERVLPDLDNNLKDGNSLIDVDFYDNALDFGEERKIKPFSWKKSFPEVFKQGGFDVVIGNPPYIPIEIFSDEEKDYYKKNFSELSRKYESSVLFILKSIKLINDNGSVGFISTQTWQTGENYIEFRKKIFKNHGVKEIINLPFNIFKDAYVDTGIFIFTKTTSDSYSYYAYNKKDALSKIETLSFETIKSKDIKAPDYKIILSNTTSSVLSKFNPEKYVSLGEITISTQGLSASCFPPTKNSKSKWAIPYINATVKRYNFTKDHQHTTDLETHQSLHKFYIKKEKILIRRIINRQDRLDATFFDEMGVFKKDLNPFIVTNKNYSTKFLLGLINSRLFSWIYIHTSSIATKDDFRQTTLSELRKLPIRKIEDADTVTKSKCNEIIKLVDLLLKLNEEEKDSKIRSKTEHIKQRIEHAEGRINQLVYQLYELTPEEIKIVEGGPNE
jgi:type I restriction-modification system DNA methylase subunit